MPNTIEVDGVVYMCGTAGGFILSCPSCGCDRFRHEVPNIEWEKCFYCSDVKKREATQLEMVRQDELETKWKPLWNKVDGVGE